MVTRAENEMITRVEGDAPLGRMLRDNFWMPFARSEALEPGGAPQRVRLLGTDLVAFRGEDGTLGLVDERCPHRRASLALARVEGCHLRCLYHGWKLDAAGQVVEVPSEGERSAQFAARVTTNRYHVREGGGLVWAFLGEGRPPALPPLPFMEVGPEGRWWTRMTVKCNWLQGFEGALDSVHLNFLHTGYNQGAPGEKAFLPSMPSYEIDETAYGLRTAAIRPSDGGKVHFRVAEFISPFYAFSASRQPVVATDHSCFISVPVDDETHILFFGFWDSTGRLADVSKFFSADLDRDNLISPEANLANMWHQDREAMARGHYSGLTTSVLHEDVAVQESMGPIVEREKEQLCATDLAIVRMRQFLLDQLRRQDAGEPVDGALANYAEGGYVSFSYEAPSGSDWRQGGQRTKRAA
jgi:phenylpropionate dioxygenase-like ring-hydroxylating dioxygenase large terminal subunit